MMSEDKVVAKRVCSREDEEGVEEERKEGRKARKWSFVVIVGEG